MADQPAGVVDAPLLRQPSHELGLLAEVRQRVLSPVDGRAEPLEVVVLEHAPPPRDVAPLLRQRLLPKLGLGRDVGRRLLLERAELRLAARRAVEDEGVAEPLRAVAVVAVAVVAVVAVVVGARNHCGGGDDGDDDDDDARKALTLACCGSSSLVSRPCCSRGRPVL